MDGVLSHWEVGGSKNGFVRLVVCIEFIQVVWVFDSWVLVETQELLLEEPINNGDLGYFGQKSKCLEKRSTRCLRSVRYSWIWI